MMQFHPRHPSAKWIFFQGSAWILSKSIENMQNQNVEDKSMLTVAWLMLLFNSYLNNYIFLHCNIQTPTFSELNLFLLQSSLIYQF